MSKAPSKSWKYYVYELIDPRTSEVFYVGKGCGDRIDEHERETLAGVSSKKCNKIRKIINGGLTIGKRKIAFFKGEADAYAFEDERIRFYGKSGLTNVAPLCGELPATVNIYLSDAYMRIIAFGLQFRAGVKRDYSDLPFASAVHKAFLPRIDEFLQRGLKEAGFEAVRDGVRRYGIVLTNGG